MGGMRSGEARLGPEPEADAPDSCNWDDTLTQLPRFGGPDQPEPGPHHPKFSSDLGLTSVGERPLLSSHVCCLEVPVALYLDLAHSWMVYSFSNHQGSSLMILATANLTETYKVFHLLCRGL